MIAYSVTKQSDDGIEHFQLFLTKEMADEVAKKWVDNDVERKRLHQKEEEARYGFDYIPDPFPFEWRWSEEYNEWQYGPSDADYSIRTICVHEVDIHETIPVE